MPDLSQLDSRTAPSQSPGQTIWLDPTDAASKELPGQSAAARSLATPRPPSNRNQMCLCVCTAAVEMFWRVFVAFWLFLYVSVYLRVRLAYLCSSSVPLRETCGWGWNASRIKLIERTGSCVLPSTAQASVVVSFCAARMAGDATQ